MKWLHIDHGKGCSMHSLLPWFIAQDLTENQAPDYKDRRCLTRKEEDNTPNIGQF